VRIFLAIIGLMIVISWMCMSMVLVLGSSGCRCCHLLIALVTFPLSVLGMGLFITNIESRNNK
jgi:hypothetical protein